MLHRTLAAVASALGHGLRTLPGVGGATAVAIGAGLLGGLAVGLIVGGFFGLLLDREL